MSEEPMLDKLKTLESERDELKQELSRIKRKPQGEVAYILLALGLILLALAIFHSHNVSAFIGIAITFWGALLLYVKPTKFIRMEILEASITGYLDNIEILLNKLNLRGTPKYYSPRTLEAYRNAYVIILNDDDDEFLSDEKISENISFYNNPLAVKITPPGFYLSEILKNELKTSFSNNDSKILYEQLEKILVETYEIASSYKMEGDNSLVVVDMKNTYFDKFIDIIKDKKYLKYIGDPLISAIACILTTLTHNIVLIKSITTNFNDKNTKIVFQIQKKNN